MKKTILIVEDEILIGMMLVQNMLKIGYQPCQDVATSAEEAIAAVKNEQPDVILMDISLAGNMDGIEAAQIIKQEYDIPVLFFTGYRDAQLIKRAEAVNPVAILDKLGPPEALQEALSSLFA